MMISGVNGAGKTTTIGKLAKHMQTHGQSVLLAAGDTFRAAARAADGLGPAQQHHRDFASLGRPGRGVV
jgi:signal recognition particle GTPase